MASFGRVTNLLTAIPIHLQDVTGNVEPLPALLPYEHYKQDIVVYMMSISPEVLMILLQEFTASVAQRTGEEVWTWCTQWEPVLGVPASLPTPTAKKPRLDATQFEDSRTQLPNGPLLAVTGRKLHPDFMGQADMLRILINIVQVPQHLVPNYIEFLYQYIDFHVGDGMALEAAIRKEIPSLWDFQNHPYQVKDGQVPSIFDLMKQPRNKPDLIAMERQTRGSARLQYGEVKYGLKPPEVENEPIPLVINIPENDDMERQKYFAACFKSRQRAMLLLLEQGITMKQVSNYQMLQKLHPRDTPGKEQGDGLKYYLEDSEASQEYLSLKEKRASLTREKHREISISNDLDRQAQVAALTASIDTPSSSNNPSGGSSIAPPLIPPTPSYVNPSPPEDFAAVMLRRIREKVEKRKANVGLYNPPAPLRDLVRSDLFIRPKPRSMSEDDISSLLNDISNRIKAMRPFESYSNYGYGSPSQSDEDVTMGGTQHEGAFSRIGENPLRYETLVGTNPAAQGSQASSSSAAVHGSSPSGYPPPPFIPQGFSLSEYRGISTGPPYPPPPPPPPPPGFQFPERPPPPGFAPHPSPGSTGPSFPAPPSGSQFPERPPPPGFAPHPSPGFTGPPFPAPPSGSQFPNRPPPPGFGPGLPNPPTLGNPTLGFGPRLPDAASAPIRPPPPGFALSEESHDRPMSGTEELNQSELPMRPNQPALHQRRQSNAPPPLNLGASSSQLPSVQAASASSPATSESNIPILIHVPRVMIPRWRLVIGAADPVGNAVASEGDALLLGYTTPGSSKIELSRAVFLPMNVWPNIEKKIYASQMKVVEVYRHPRPLPVPSLVSRSGRQMQVSPVQETSHWRAYMKLVQAFSIIKSSDNREKDLTKRWRVSRGPMSEMDRGAIWEGWAAYVDRKVEMTKEDRKMADILRYCIDPYDAEAVREKQRRIAEIEEFLKEQEEEESDEDEDENEGGADE